MQHDSFDDFFALTFVHSTSIFNDRIQFQFQVYYFALVRHRSNKKRTKKNYTSNNKYTFGCTHLRRCFYFFPVYLLQLQTNKQELTQHLYKTSYFRAEHKSVFSYFQQQTIDEDDKYCGRKNVGDIKRTLCQCAMLAHTHTKYTILISHKFFSKT